MSGIRLLRDEREQGAGLGRPHHSWSETGVLYDGAEPTHIARPLPEDEAREAVIAAARALIDANTPREENERLVALASTIDALDAT